MAKPDSDYNMDEVLNTYRLDGSMLRSKSRVLLEDWIERIYPRMQDDTTPTSTLLDIGKTLIELGDMKPKTSAQSVATGPTMTITINIPQSEGKEPIVIEGVSQVIDSAEDEGDPFLPEPPSGISIPDFELNSDLTDDE